MPTGLALCGTENQLQWPTLPGFRVSVLPQEPFTLISETHASKPITQTRSTPPMLSPQLSQFYHGQAPCFPWPLLSLLAHLPFTSKPTHLSVILLMLMPGEDFTSGSFWVS